MKTDMVCGALLLAVSAAGAGEWHVLRPIVGDAVERATVVAVKVDEHVFANSLPDLADVRVLDARGREVPRVIEAERGYAFKERHAPLAAKVRSVEQLPEGGLAVVCAVELTNAVSLTQLTVHTPLRNYEQTVTVYVPAEGAAWRQAQAPEPLYDYSRFADVRKESVALSGLTNKLFRLVIGQADDRVFSAYASVTEETGGAAEARQTRRYEVERRPFRIDAVTVRDTARVAVPEQAVEAVAAAREVSVKEEAEQKTTVVTFATRWQPVCGVELNPGEQNFERAVTVECPAPGGWREVGAGRVVRSRLPGLSRQETELRFPEVRAERLRVRVRNDDNPPLTFGAGSVACRRQAYRVSFIAEPGAAYRLAYCDPAVKGQPVYEQGVTAYLTRGLEAALWRLGAAPEADVAGGGRSGVRRFLEKHGLKALSALVLAVLGLLVMRAVKHVG